MDCNYIGIGVGFGLSFSVYAIPYLCDSIQKKFLQFNKELPRCLDEPRLSKEGIEEIMHYSNSLSDDSKTIIYKLLDEIKEREVEAKTLGKNLESSLIKK